MRIGAFGGTSLASGTDALLNDTRLFAVRGAVRQAASQFRDVSRYPSDDMPQTLFLQGQQGMWYDPSDPSTMFQDAEGTVPITNVGQPVRLIRDKSGNNNHASASADSRRPVLQQDEKGAYYLEFDGVDDCLFTGSVNFSATNKMAVCAGLRKLTDATAGVVIELNTSSTAPGAFSFFAGSATATRRVAWSVAATQNFIGSSQFPAPATVVMSALYDRLGTTAADRINPRLNGAPADLSETISAALSGNFANAPIFVGARNNGEVRFNGRLYQLVVRGADTDAQSFARLESFVNAKTQAY